MPPDVAGLLVERGHPHVLDPARHDPLERLEVVVDVDREAVRRHAALHVDADRADLAVVDPDAGQAVADLRLDPLVGERGDQRRAPSSRRYSTTSPICMIG